MSPLGLNFTSVDWHAQAACARVPDTVRKQFVRSVYDAQRDAKNPDFVEALKTCRRCPVRQKCLEWTDIAENYSQNASSLGGLYAGETPVLRARRRRAEKQSKKKS